MPTLCEAAARSWVVREHRHLDHHLRQFGVWSIMNPAARYLAPALALSLLLGCDPTETATTDELLITVQGGTLSGPDSLSPGWTRLRVEEDGSGHIVVVFRLSDGADPAAFLAGLDTAQATPGLALALGGPEIGDTGELVLNFTPGRYLLGCVRRGPGGHRHASSGESRIIVVPTAPVPATPDAAPSATVDLKLADFAYVGPDHWPAGAGMVRVENIGKQDHQLRLIQLPAGTTVQDWMNAEDPGEVGTPVIGVARIGSGAVAYLPVDLSPGSYVAYCLITDPASGEEHVLMGMLRAIQVGEQAEAARP
jgi:hypothetical protein